MHLHDITDLDHDTSLFSDDAWYVPSICDNCGARTDEHGISVERDRSCDLCAGEV